MRKHAAAGFLLMATRQDVLAVFLCKQIDFIFSLCQSKIRGAKHESQPQIVLRICFDDNSIRLR
jgi:uncharacterized membrane protein